MVDFPRPTAEWGVESFLHRIRSVWRAHRGQEEFLTNSAKMKVLACGRRWGKTDACAVGVVASLDGPNPTKHLLLAPTLAQARHLFDRVIDLLRAIIGTGGMQEGDAISYTPFPRLRYLVHSVVARSGHVGRFLRGGDATNIIVDEAAFVPEPLITEVAMPMLATSSGDLTLISTPNGKNHFWKFFEMGLRGEHGVWSRHGPTADSPLVKPEFLAIQRELISERAFAVEYEAKFLQSEGAVFRKEALDRCLVDTLPVAEGPFVIGVDWARKQDWTTVCVLSGIRSKATVCEIGQMPRGSWAAIIASVAAVIRRYPGARVLCDGTGIGDSLLGLLRTELDEFSVSPYEFTAQSKGLLIESLVKAIETGALRMRPDPDLMRELESFESRTTPSGHLAYGGAGGSHDDLVVALALAVFALPSGYNAGIVAGRPRRFPTL